MNKKQIIILWVGIAIIVLMGLFPPCMRTHENLGGYKSDGFSFILDLRGDRVDVPQLLVQWFMVVLVTGALMVTLKDVGPLVRKLFNLDDKNKPMVVVPEEQGGEDE